MADENLIGKYALCSEGHIGLITRREEITYPDGETALAWCGVHVSGELTGQPWSSRNPVVLDSMGSGHQ